MEKIKVDLSGSAETMLQSFYARALYSKKKNSKFYDAKAVGIVDRIDYDFSLAEKDNTMSSGVVARTIVFDELVSAFIKKNPDCTVVNIACGLDTRVYRMDNGRLTWYNVDLPETAAVRKQIYGEEGRISTIGISALDSKWADEIKVRGKMLFIIEGLSMYLTAEENKQMLGIIRDHFDNATVMLECIAKRWVNQEGIEKSIQQTGAKYVFGADCFADLGDVAEGFRKIKDDNITRGMEKLYPAMKLVTWLPIANKVTEKILIFEK
ncbi:MAG: class I SAM-dependent methyltransferase [Eubacteriales bacterium]|nr:class I SAM-dependent methyltransferase [Eubacteriales bacterium]